MIKGDVLVDMPLKALKERINGHGRKIVNKKFNDADSFYISHKKVPKVIPRTPEPHKKSTPEVPLTLLAPNLINLILIKSSLREFETEIMEFK